MALSFSKLNFHVVLDAYRIDMILNSVPNEGKVIIDMDKFSISFSDDLTDASRYAAADDSKTGFYKMIEAFSNAIQNPKIKNVFLVGLDNIDTEDLIPIIYRNLHRITCTIHLIGYNEYSLPYELRILCKTITYPPSTPEERRKILQEAGISDLDRAIKITEGLTLSEVSSVAEMCKGGGVPVEEAVANIKSGKLRDFGLELIGKDIPSIRELNTVSRKFKKVVMELVDSHEKVSILFAGSPGSGKTYFATSLLNAMPPPSVKLDSARIVQSTRKERDLSRNMLRVIENINPTGILIDQFELLSGKHGLDHMVIMDKVLSWLESRRFGILLSTTTKLDEIDPQLIRPGRFDAVVLVPLPGYEERYNILKLYGVRDGLARRLAAEYRYYTPADLMNIAKLYKETGKYPRPNPEYMKKSRETYYKNLNLVKKLSNGIIVEEVIT